MGRLSLPDMDSVPPPSGTSVEARLTWCVDNFHGPHRHLPARVRKLEEDLGSAPNLATGAEGTGAFRTIAKGEAARREAEQRVAYLRGMLHGLGAAAALVSAVLGILRALGALKGP